MILLGSKSAVLKGETKVVCGVDSRMLYQADHQMNEIGSRVEETKTMVLLEVEK